MGSFNTTCFASGQTIAPGDKCFILPIRQQSGYRAVEVEVEDEKQDCWGISAATCYPNAFWNPAGAFLEAVYDDYGRVELEQTPLNRRRLFNFILSLANSAAVVQWGENKCHDVPFNLPEFLEKEAPLVNSVRTKTRTEKFDEIELEALFAELVHTWNYIFDVAAEHRLFVGKHYNKVVRPVQFAIMHEASYNNLIKMCDSQTNWSDESLAQRSFLERAIKATKEYEVAAVNEPGVDEELKKLAAVMRNMHFNDALRRIGEFSSMPYPGEHEEIASAMKKCGSNLDDVDSLFESLKPVLDARYVMMGLDIINVKISPMVYASQDYDNEIGRAYAKFIRATSATVSKSRKDRYKD